MFRGCVQFLLFEMEELKDVLNCLDTLYKSAGKFGANDPSPILKIV